MLTSLFDALGRAVARRPVTVVALWFVLAAGGFVLATTGLGGPTLLDRVTVAAPSAKGSDSAAADAALAGAASGDGSVSLVVRGADPADAAVGAAMGTLSDELAAVDGVASVVNPYVLDGGLDNPVAHDLVAQDGDGFVTYVLLEDGQAGTAAAHDAVVERLGAVPGELRRAAGDAAPSASGLVTSTGLVEDAVRDQAADDLRTGTLLALPAALVVALLALGSLLAAAVPLAAAVATFGTGLGVLYALTYLPGHAGAVDSSLPAVVALLASGVALGDALFVTARFRQELVAGSRPVAGSRQLRRRRRDGAVVEVVARTSASAVRTVALSTLCLVAAAAAVLVLSPTVTLGAGAGVLAATVLALLAAVTLVPALLALTEHRLVPPGALHVAAGRAPVGSYRTALDKVRRSRRGAVRFVRRHRRAVALCGLVVLLGLAVPAFAVQVRATSPVELLPHDADQRRFVETVAASYPAGEGPAMTVLADAAPADVGQLLGKIGALGSVTRTDEPTQLTVAKTQATRTEATRTMLGVYTDTGDATSRQTQDVVRSVRGLDLPYDVQVTGRAATQIDLAAAFAQRAWLAALVAALVVALLTFVATGSVPVSVAAVGSGALTLGVALGALVTGYQWGVLVPRLGGTSAGGIEAHVLATTAALSFGIGCAGVLLATSRVAEARSDGDPDTEAVRRGLHRSRRPVLGAVLVVVVVGAAFMASGGLVITEVGFAVAVAALVDLVVLALLWPAALALLGRTAWWAPDALRAIHLRVG